MAETFFIVVQCILIISVSIVLLCSICKIFTLDTSLLSFSQFEEEYEKYLKKNNCVRFEYRISEDDFEELNEYSPEEAQEKEDRFIYAEFDLCDEFIRRKPKNLYARERRAYLYSILKDYDFLNYNCKNGVTFWGNPLNRLTPFGLPGL